MAIAASASWMSNATYCATSAACHRRGPKTVSKLRLVMHSHSFVFWPKRAKPDAGDIGSAIREKGVVINILVTKRCYSE